MKKVCFFGIYNPNYSRNRILQVGFEENGYKVINCRVNPKLDLGISKYWKLYKEYRRLGLSHDPCDLVIVAFPGHTVVLLARLLFGRKFIFDAFISLYDSNVMDRRLYSSFNPKAWRDFLLDWFSVKLAPVVLLDTKEHIKYFNKTFGLDLKKAIGVFVGTDDRYFSPAPKTVPSDSGKFIVHFHGSYIPLQGVEYIIRSAAGLSNSGIFFRLIGGGQERKSAEALVKKLNTRNVEFVEPVDYGELAKYMNSAEICLGIFGTSNKAGRVIPNKIFEALACGRPIITEDSAAARELLSDGKNVILCKAGDEASLAEAIVKLKSDLSLREKIGLEARKLYEEKLTPVKIVSKLLNDLK